MELYISAMAGFVLGTFLITGEIAALRKQAPGLAAWFKRQSGHKARRIAAIVGIAAFFLIQPVIVAVLIAAALGQIDANFPAYLLREIMPR